MKKILFFILLGVIILFLEASPVRAGLCLSSNCCGSSDCANPKHMEYAELESDTNTITVSCSAQGTLPLYYYFSLDTSHDVTISLNVTQGSAKFDLFQWEGGCGSAYVSDKTYFTYDLAGTSWTIKVIPTQSTTAFTLTVSIAEEGAKANGQSCTYYWDCLSEKCVHGICRATNPYCGDSYCDSDKGESCSGCVADCGSCGPSKKQDGYSCYSGDECLGGYCVHGICRSAAAYCGDGYCDSDQGECCTYCSTDCGTCEEIGKPDGSSCDSDGECAGYFCIHGVCRTETPGHEIRHLGNLNYSYCGDNYCDKAVGLWEGENCGNCASDCKICDNPTKEDGDYCDYNFECFGGYCVKGYCSSYPTYCGDDKCLGEEDCVSCPNDCACGSNQCCCANYVDTVMDSRGCVKHGGIIASDSICCNGYSYYGNCCSDSDCSYGQICSDHYCGKKSEGAKCTFNYECSGGYCVHGICRSESYSCGDGYCDSGESCSTCERDCACGANKCCMGFIGSSMQPSSYMIQETRDAKGCVPEREKGVYGATGIVGPDEYKYYYICCNGNIETVGEKYAEGKGPECCSDSDCPAGERCSYQYCVAEKQDEGASALAEETQNLLNEYLGYLGEISSLNEKIEVSELKMEVSPLEMHNAIHGLVKDLVAEGKNDEAQALLKNVIAAEKLALATYRGESEMAQMLAESSWQSLRVYLLHKVEVIIGSQLEKVSLQLGVNPEKVSEIASSASEQTESLEKILKNLGIEDPTGIIDATNQSYGQAQGNVTKYLENIESQVKQLYIDTYVSMFDENFKEAISDQLVYYQVSAWHYTQYRGPIPGFNLPYDEYQTAIENIGKEIAEEKQFISGDNVFARTASLNDKFKEGADEIDKILAQLGAAAFAIDKGAKLMGKETNLGDIVDDLGEYNKSLQDAVDLAAQTLDLAGKFAESTYGTYKEAKLYSIFYSAYDRWYENCLGGYVVTLKIPMTGLKLDITEVYKLSESLLSTADQILVMSGEALNYVVDGAQAIADAGVELIKEVGQTLNTSITEGLKITQKIVNGGETLVYMLKWAGYLSPEENLLMICPAYAQSAEPNSVIELTLISPPGIKFPGIPYNDGSGLYVVINNPEPGEWLAEITGKIVQGEQTLEIITNAEKGALGEFKTEMIDKKTSSLLTQLATIIAALPILIILLFWRKVDLLRALDRLKKRLRKP